MRIFTAFAALLLPFAALSARGEEASSGAEHMIIQTLCDEMAYSMENLAMPDGTRPYFIAYTIDDLKSLSMGAELGAVTRDTDGHDRILSVSVRVGDYDLDSTHKIRGGDNFGGFSILGGATGISLENDPLAIRQAIWLATDQAFKDGVKNYQRIETNLKTKVEEEDPSPDFSHEEPQVFFEPEVDYVLDRGLWAARLRRISLKAHDYPLIYNSSVSLSVNVTNQYLVNSEGTRIQTGIKHFRVIVSASTKADDGMELDQSDIFNASSEDRLPTEEAVTEAFERVLRQVVALRDAPVVEPYTGPAILVNRASGVFFHEIFGHRIEGHRQKDVEEGQTFTKMVGEPILPEFITVTDDPTLPRFGDEDLRGYYKYDDEGVPAQKVLLVDQGVLKNFLMCRSPIQGFPHSNGHGRCQPGNEVVSRMGNTMITSTKTMPFNDLKQMLIEECKKQDKPYGLLFEDISGGFTGTRRGSAQVFKVLPLVVYRIYPDGRPDELVRGVDIVGTPLTCFAEILATGDDPAVFNGTCGAESGSVPVSAISPSILVGQMEIEKQSRDQDKPPILPPPIAEKRNDG